MKRYNLLTALLAVIILSFSVAIFAAEDVKSDDKKEDAKAAEDEKNYLMLFEAKANIERLIKSNLEEMNIMHVCIENFQQKDQIFSGSIKVPDKIDPTKGEDVTIKAKFDKIKEDYSKAMVNYYKRKYVLANNQLIQVKKDLHLVYRAAYEAYKARTDKILDASAQAVMRMDVNPSTHKNDKAKEKLQINQARLRLGYNNFADAAAADYNDYYVGAIYYLRVAKSYGIAVLDDLSKANLEEVNKFAQEKSKELVMEEDTEDNKGRIKQK